MNSKQRQQLTVTGAILFIYFFNGQKATSN